MKKITAIFLSLSFPLLLSAQQKESIQQDQLRKEINVLRMEMQAKINSLQDSLLVLQRKLNEQQLLQSPQYRDLYRYLTPGSDGNGMIVVPLDSALLDHSFNWDFQFDAPEIPETPLMSPDDFHIPPHLQYPQSPDFYFYRLPQPEQPHPEFYLPPDNLFEKKHKPGILKMLPFYNLFKS